MGFVQVENLAVTKLIDFLAWAVYSSISDHMMIPLKNSGFQISK